MTKTTVLIDGKEFVGDVRVELTTPDDGLPSRTGREPRILWSRRWQATWEAAEAAEHPWSLWNRFACEQPESAHFDKELHPTIRYAVVGDPAHARQAWSQLAERIAKGQPSQDSIRANWLKWLVCWEWLWPALTADERTRLAAFLDGCAEAVAATPLADSDRLVTAYFGTRVWCALSGKPPPETAAMEERLVEYARLSEGGDWVEGTYYSTGTMTTFVLGLEACEDLGLAVPPELNSLPVQLALAERHHWDNALSQRLGWGAIQTDLYPRTGIKRGDLILNNWSAIGLHDMIDRTQAKGGYWQKPHGLFFIWARPDWRAE